MTNQLIYSSFKHCICILYTSMVLCMHSYYQNKITTFVMDSVHDNIEKVILTKITTIKLKNPAIN